MQLLKLSIKRAKKDTQGVAIYLKLNKKMLPLLRVDEATRTSSQWKQEDGTPIEYYSTIPPVAESINAKIDAFGYGLKTDRYDRSSWNASILRAKGIENGITLLTDGMYTRDELKDYSEYLGQLVKELYQQFVKPVTVTTTVKD